jgi:hypothetical protein
VTNRNPGVETTQYTTSIPAGTSQRVEYPTIGMNVVVTRTVTDASGAVIHHDVFVSNYARVDGLTLIGRAGASPIPTPTPNPTPNPTPAPTPSPS